MDKTYIWSQISTTPAIARKEITAGRLKGFTDINPMWRFKSLTEVFGACGIGWKMDDINFEIIDGADGEKKAFCNLKLYYKLENGEWSDGVFGCGGSSFVSKEKNGFYTNDECFKMALSDAVGTACKALGMSADIYFSKDRTKYTAPAEPTSQPYKAPADKMFPEEQITFSPVCAECECAISPKVHDFSIKQYGKPLCMECQSKQKKK